MFIRPLTDSPRSLANDSISSSALVSYCGIETPKSFRNNVAYIQNWLQVLRNDKRLIVSASGKAEKAVGLILNSQY